MNSIIVLFCLSAITPWTFGEKIHMKMTKREVSAIFGQPHHDLVPEYDLVRLNFPKRHRRDVDTPQMLTYNALGDEIDVYLWPSNAVLATEDTPVYEAFGVGLVRPKFIIKPNAMKNAGDLWENPANNISLVVKRDTRGKYLMDGFIGSHNMIVRSLPDHISDHLERTSPDSHLPDHSAYHVVYRPKERSLEDHLQNAPLMNRNFQEEYKYDVLYPEIMVAVDFDIYLDNDRDFNRILAYVVAFWNAVDILYRQFDHPQIRLRIAAVVIATDSRAFPYLYKNQQEDGKLYPFKALEDAGTFYYQEREIFPNTSYDGIVTMTRQNMIGALGIAVLGGLCKINSTSRSVLSVSIVHDDGIFSDVIVAAHELGHLFNMGHDGDSGNECSTDDGYIMANGLHHSSNNFYFSNCSVKEFSKFIYGKGMDCARNVPSLAGSIDRFLPAELITRDQHCKSKWGPGYEAYVPDVYDAATYNPCLTTYCKKSNSGSNTETYPLQIPAPEGSKCATGKYCAHGMCLRRHLPPGKVRS